MGCFNEYTYLSSDGKTEIFAREIIPEGEIKGFVQIAHGVSEHGDRYKEFMSILADNGYAAIANDHLGHGKSLPDGKELFFAKEDGWFNVVEDMKILHDKLAERFPGKEAILFGHSMGSFLARTYIIKYPNDFNKAIICGTGQQSPLLVSAGKLLATLACKKNGADVPNMQLYGIAFGGYNKAFEPKRTDCDWLSRNEANVDAYIADPACGGIPTAGLMRDMMTGISFIGKKENADKMNKDMPVFLIAGDKDPVGEMGKGVKRVYTLFKAVGMKNVKVKLYKDDRHEILNEVDKDKVFEDILRWIKKY